MTHKHAHIGRRNWKKSNWFNEQAYTLVNDTCGYKYVGGQPPRDV